MKTYEKPNLTLIVSREDIVRTSYATEIDPVKDDIFYEGAIEE